MVYNLALHYTQNVEDAEEITQDVFVAAHDGYGKFKHEAAITTWLYRITINKSLDFLKAKKRKKRFAIITSLFYDDSNNLKHDTADHRHPGVLLEDQENINRLFEQINKLPSNQKTAIILQKIEDKTQAEVAEIMNISIKAVSQLMQRAKVNLSKYLGKTVE
jgi:RNA polymerase sigma factor (sigma-70 family)